MVLGAVWAVVGLPAWAQQATGTSSDVTELQEVVVTGSRIAAPNQKATSPIQVVTTADIQATGKTDISDVINQLPQNFNNSLGQDLGNRTSGLTTAGGVATADLRGLGPNRTLVLVDGRRLGQGSPYTFIQAPAPDLDQIPTFMVERVEVVTGGASAVYGSDAIAGVVNFILKKNFQGIQLDAQFGENWHSNHNSYAENAAKAFGLTPLTDTVTDGKNKTFSLIMGTNFADNQGNVTAYLTYLHADPVPSGNRDFGQCQLAASKDANGNVIGAACAGSANSNYFRPQGTLVNGVFTKNVGAEYSVLGSSFIPNGSAVTTPPAAFNSQPYIYMQRQDDRYLGGFLAHDDLSDYVKPYIEFAFMNDRTHQQVAPAALFRDSNPNDPHGGNYVINCSNPLLSAQEAAILCSPAQIAADAANPGSNSADVRIGRRNIEGGGRSSDYEHTNYRAVIGAKGAFANAWSYDAYSQYYYTQFFNSNQKYLSFANIGNALQVKGTAANPSCISGAPCVPYNIFSDGGVTQQQLNYLYLAGTGAGSTTLRTLHADITGQLGEYGIKSPLANDGVAVNIGWENRNENVAFTPDSGELSGQLSGFGSAAVAINNSVSVGEEFIELRAPLMQDKPGVKDLVFGTGFRRSDYSVSGVVNTYKFDVQYAPIEDVRFRGSFNRAIRAPSIIELYNPQLVGLIQFGNDPCAPPATRSLADCMKSGVTAAEYGNGTTTNTIPQATIGQLSQLTGGNPKLQPETATTYSVGVTVSPADIPNLTGSIDYYHIKIAGEVNTVPADVIVTKCLNTGDPTYCSQIVRSPSTGGLVGNSIASGGYIVQTNVNIGAALVSGIDVQAGYKLTLPPGFGALAFSMNGAYLLKSETTPLPGAHTYDCAGLFGSTCQTVNPRWHHILRSTWQSPWGVDASLTWRFIGKVGLDNNDPDPTLHFAKFKAYNFFDSQLPNISYLDLAASWNVTKEITIRGGIDNILDKDPPLATFEITAGGAANAYSAYDQLGRQIFVAFTAKF
jgi:outer membrane receptor protein involved in Fe transport